MTVSQLIEKLKAFDPNSKVVRASADNSYVEVSSVIAVKELTSKLSQYFDKTSAGSDTDQVVQIK